MISAVDHAALAPWQVRRLQPDDVPAVMAIEREIYPFPWTDGNFTDSLIAGYDGWGLFADGVLIGYSVVMWIPDEVHLLNLSIAADWQGQGIGRRFLGWLCDSTARRGARAMLLEVRPSNDRARRLYETGGFETVGVRKRYYPSFNETREDALVMRRALNLETAVEPASPGGNPT
ncbi:MAG: ribosomal protein S18-alanine N-acetyltransferase [Burkholderiales bacterium]|nr:ribosomal protein S18-alanine N-acetyltransferase [Burkholderiales bacterium]